MAVQLDKRGLLAYWHDLKATSALAFGENSSRGGLETCLLSDQFTHPREDPLRNSLHPLYVTLLLDTLFYSYYDTYDIRPSYSS